MKVLITAGSTWVRIDDVRIITNIFTGNTGLLLARRFHKAGHDVTLLINPARIKKIPAGVEVIEFFYLEELRSSLKRILQERRYDLIIHTAAVSDYYVKDVYRGKIPSRKDVWALRLHPAPKLIRGIRKMAKDAVIVQFKLEVSSDGLLDKAWRSLKDNRSDLVVANALEDIRRKYQAFIIDSNRHLYKVGSLPGLARLLLAVIPSVRR